MDLESPAADEGLGLLCAEHAEQFRTCHSSLCGHAGSQRSWCTAVYGISWDLCQRAMQSSLTAVSRGFPASWPSDLPCANVSYSGPDKPFNHIVSLPAGTHTLWTGLMMEAGGQALGWMQAWIEISDTLGPLFPAIREV